ncbi:MAG: hypothetical protein ACRDY2_07685 [Acidimicrobiales bacterium]
MPVELAGWLAHALLLTRQSSMVAADELPRALELATVRVKPGLVDGYPMLETFSEGRRTMVLAHANQTPVLTGGRH